MRYFGWVDMQYELLALFLGAVALILVYLAWGSYPKRRIFRSLDELQEMRGHERQPDLDAGENPIAPFTAFLYVLIPLWSFFYVVYIWASASKF